ncbi:MAG TPA: chloride channel protein [Candidatus Hydrogenedentes bacterium]|nr:chloride channel protein [Candidatus Hydrogenedentota bacterium]
MENVELVRLPENAQRVFQTIVLSLTAGFMAVVFLKSTNLLFQGTYGVLASHSKAVFMAGSFILITVSSLVVSLILRYTPDAVGSGVPQLKVAYWKELGYVPWRPVLAKFVAGVISLGGGASLGREGPTLYMCGGLSSALSGYLGMPKRGRRAALTMGSAAGLAAAFNTPLASITFVLEELVGDLSNRYLGAVVLASVMGALAVQASLGPQPAFALPEVNDTTWELYLVVPLVALLATACGIVFEKGTLLLRRRLITQRLIPKWILPFFGGLLTWCIAISVYFSTSKIGIFGLGYGDLSEALGQGIPWRLAGLLMAGKIAATLVSYGFGGCGGIFSPTLFIGGMCGFFVAGAGALWLPLTSSDHVILAGVGMCVCLCAVIRAPLTSMLIVFEMTHEFALVPPLMIGVIICEAVTRLFGNENFYTSLLLQDGHELVKINPPRDLQSWQAIQAGKLMSGKVVSFEALETGQARQVLATSPYRCFPVKHEGELVGIVTRDEIQKFIQSGNPPHIEVAVTCYPDQTIQELADKFILSPSGILVVTDEADGTLLGILTLHDLLRAQAAVLDGTLA